MNIQYHTATQDDLTHIIKMLADDQLGSTREDPSLPIHQQYLDTFAIINADPNNELIVLKSDDSANPAVMGILQLTYIPYLTYKGSWRCLIEGVRIHQDFRGRGLGTKLFEWAIDRAKQRGCNIVQLTSNKKRNEAIRFYESLGFEATHEGFKLFF